MDAFSFNKKCVKMLILDTMPVNKIECLLTFGRPYNRSSAVCLPTNERSMAVYETTAWAQAQASNVPANVKPHTKCTRLQSR